MARARAAGLDPSDEFRGLYISDEQVDTLLNQELGQHLWSVTNGQPETASGSGRNVQVTAYGSGNEACKVANWNAFGEDFSANVRCFDADGQPVDTRYTVFVVQQ